MKSPKNIPASVRQRLLNRAKNDQRPFNELLQYYAMERFLFRLSQSPHADRFILKGALMLRVWRSPEFRPTMDIDMLGRTSNEEASIVAQIREVMAVNVEPDGLTFDPESIQSERITEDADYEGIRVRFRWDETGRGNSSDLPEKRNFASSENRSVRTAFHRCQADSVVGFPQEASARPCTRIFQGCRICGGGFPCTTHDPAITRQP